MMIPCSFTKRTLNLTCPWLPLEAPSKFIFKNVGGWDHVKELEEHMEQREGAKEVGGAPQQSLSI